MTEYWSWCRNMAELRTHGFIPCRIIKVGVIRVCLRAFKPVSQCVWECVWPTPPPHFAHCSAATIASCELCIRSAAGCLRSVASL